MVTLLSSISTLTLRLFATASRPASASSPSIWLPSEVSSTSAFPGLASATPLQKAHRWPSRPELNCTPGVSSFSG